MEEKISLEYLRDTACQWIKDHPAIKSIYLVTANRSDGKEVHAHYRYTLIAIVPDPKDDDYRSWAGDGFHYNFLEDDVRDCGLVDFSWVTWSSLDEAQEYVDENIMDNLQKGAKVKWEDLTSDMESQEENQSLTPQIIKPQSQEKTNKNDTDQVNNVELELPPQANDPACRNGMRQLFVTAYGRAPSRKEIDNLFSKSIITTGIESATFEELASESAEPSALSQIERENMADEPQQMQEVPGQEPAQNTTAENTPRQSRNNKPLFDRQVWEEAVRLYKTVLKSGFKGSNVEKKLKIAAKEELTQNRKDYHVIKQSHLSGTALFALNPGQERRDFIGKLLQKITGKSGKKNCIGAQRLYEFGKKNYQNQN